MYCERCGQKKPYFTASQRLKRNIMHHIENDEVKRHMLNLVRLTNIEAFDRGSEYVKNRGRHDEIV